MNTKTQTEKFFDMRDARTEAIIECLQPPEKILKIKDKKEYESKFIKFRQNGKNYKYCPGEWGWLESYEFFPKMGELREFFGIPFKLSGIDYAYPAFKRRCTWSLWSGKPTVEQADKIWGVITKKRDSFFPKGEW